MALTLADNPECTNVPDLYNTLLRDNAGLFWCAVRVKPNREKEFVRRLAGQHRPVLRSKQVKFFLPVREYRSKSRNKIIKPVLPGYVFLADRSCSACIYARSAASATRLAMNTIQTKQQMQFRKEIAWFADPDAQLRAVPNTLTKHIGQPAKIKWPHRMAGLCGTFTRIDDESRLILTLPFLGQTVSVAFEENEVDFIN